MAGGMNGLRFAQQLEASTGGDRATEATPADERWAALYRAYRHVVYGRCRKLLLTRAAAEDATQEIFAKLIARVAEVPPGAAAAPWLSRVASNHCLNELRNQKRRNRAAAATEVYPASLEPVVHRDLVRWLLVNMPERLSEVAGLRYVYGLELHEIANRVCVSRRTVITRLRHFNERARLLLPIAGSTPGTRSAATRFEPTPRLRAAS